MADKDIAKLNKDLEEIHDALDALGPILEATNREMHERIENVEKLHANLAMAYTELAASVETVIHELMAPRDEEQRQQFRDDLERRHMATLEMIQNATREAAKNSKDDLAGAVSDVAEERINTPSDNA